MSENHCNLSRVDGILLMAAYANLPRIVAAAIQEGANPNVRRAGDDYSPLMLVVWSGGLASVKLLVESGADVNARIEVERDRGASALLIASQQGFEEIVKYLLESGADPNVVDADGDTPLSLAEKFQFHEIVVLLKESLN